MIEIHILCLNIMSSIIMHNSRDKILSSDHAPILIVYVIKKPQVKFHFFIRVHDGLS